MTNGIKGLKEIYMNLIVILKNQKTLCPSREERQTRILYDMVGPSSLKVTGVLKYNFRKSYRIIQVSYLN